MRITPILALTAVMGMTMSTAAYAGSRDFDLTGFDRIDIATGLDAVVTIGDSFAVSAQSGSNDALDNLELAVSGGVMSARFDQSFLDFILSGGLVGMLLNSGNAVTINVTMPALAGISASSGADVRGQGLTVTNLALEASSGAEITLDGAVLGKVSAEASSGAGITLSGSCDSVDAVASSGADIDAEDLACATVTAEASSGSDISVRASGSVRADASSGGNIDIHGNPKARDVDSSSGGDVSFDD